MGGYGSLFGDQPWGGGRHPFASSRRGNGRGRTLYGIRVKLYFIKYTINWTINYYSSFFHLKLKILKQMYGYYGGHGHHQQQLEENSAMLAAYQQHQQQQQQNGFVVF
jgi:hypothetical protein